MSSLSFADHCKFTAQRVVNKFTTKDGLLGDYNYKYLFTPRLPFTKKTEIRQPFFGLNDEMPVVLGLILGLQHSLAMLAGVITPPLIISYSVNATTDTQEYFVSASLIVSGLLSLIQITRFHIYRTPYYLGSGMLSVVGTSFGVIVVVQKVLPIMYSTGFCPVAEDGTQLPCPNGYGAILGTSCVCSLLEIAMSFIPPRFLKKLFPSTVTGTVVLLMGVSLIQSGFEDWVGGSGCVDAICPSKGAPRAAEWGSPQFVGLGFLVYVTIIICEKWGAPIMKSCSVIIGLLIGCIVSAACGYFDRSSIDAARTASFIWVETFKLSVYGPAVLPMLIVYVVLCVETIGDLTATAEVSRLEVEGPSYESRIQGGVLADGFNGLIAGLCTITPMSTFAQNNGVISITKCANRTAGYWCCFILIIMGIFTKFAASLVAIPKPVLGGMTSFLFTSVAVSGLRIIATCNFTRRDRFVLTASLLPGFGVILVPSWFSKVFSYSGTNTALQGFIDAIVIIMESPYALGGIISTILNLMLPQVSDDDEEEEIPKDPEDLDELQMDEFIQQYDDVDRQIEDAKKAKKNVTTSTLEGSKSP
jgi:NCS2 family nucleobase:cation symporter-2